jgi:mannosyl-oligosaccharide alpha-1,2-mannosidase
MFRYRRYRVFLFLAVVFIFLVWRFHNPSTWEAHSPISGTAQQQLDRLGLHTPKDPKQPDKKPDQPPDPPKIPPDSNKVKPDVVNSIAKPTQKVVAGPPADQKKETTAAPDQVGKTPVDATKIDHVVEHEFVLAEGGEGRWSQDHLPTNVVVEHWTQRSLIFPVPTESVKWLPTGKPKKIPQIQAKFKQEKEEAKDARQRKLNAIKDAFLHAWKGYKEHAWGKDEVRPVTGNSRNTFNGWCATLVDALDTMWIMGLKEQFEEAVEHVKKIDFHTSDRQNIPLFETTIRYLGGLLGAYDVSEGKYPVLLEKATELGDILMGSFDTPNHMPMVYFQWKSAFTSQPHRAPARVALAELGTLQLEFTRLSQLTGNNTYYDAVARIMDALEVWQDQTKIPGLWPADVDSSGCNTSFMYTTPSSNVVKTFAQLGKENEDKKALPTASATAVAASAEGLKDGLKLEKRQIGNIVNDSILPPHNIPEANLPRPKDIPLTKTTHLAECVAKGLDSAPSGTDMFTLGATADSTFEYLSKMWLLLGGQLDSYKSMFEKSMDAANEKLLFRIMIPDEKRELLASGDLSISPYIQHPIMSPVSAHLTCFVGGMFAMGAKLFDRPSDLEIAAKLTDGCVWAYESMATGVMPEKMQVVMCESRKTCAWNETKWWEAVDPHAGMRQQMYDEELSRYKSQIATQSATKTKAVVEPTKAEDDKARAVVTAAQQGSREPPAGFNPHSNEKEKEDKAKKPQLEKREPDAAPAVAAEEKAFTPPPAAQEEELEILPPEKPMSLQEYAKQKIENGRLKPGIKSLDDPRYLLR